MTNIREFFRYRWLKLGYLATLLLLVCALSGCTAKSDQPIQKTGFIMSTTVSVSVYDESQEHLVTDCLNMCKDYELIFSRTNPDSELYQLNAAGSMEVSDDLLTVINTALRYCELSEGRFDITTGPLSDLYKFASEDPQLPPAEALSEALTHVDYHKILVEDHRVTLLDPEAEIDLGAIAKGYIADRLKDYLLANDVHSAIINLGGNVLLVGSKPSGDDFAINLQYPFKEQTYPIATVRLSDQSIVTSGIYERYFEEDGHLYHHILDPATGYSFENDLLADSIIGPSSMDCDALSTVCFTLGRERGLALINSLDGYEATFITDDDVLHNSDGFEQYLQK